MFFIHLSAHNAEKVYLCNMICSTFAWLWFLILALRFSFSPSALALALPPAFWLWLWVWLWPSVLVRSRFYDFASNPASSPR